MSRGLGAWISATRRRRREDHLGPPLSPGIMAAGASVGPDCWRASAAAIVTWLGEGPAGVAFEAGISYADVVRRTVNLDGSAVPPPDAARESAETLLGIAAHEGGHLRSSPAPDPTEKPVFLWLVNVLEDERVESLTARDFPALAHPLHAARQTLLASRPEDGAALAAIFSLVRLPERMSRDQWTAHRDLLLTVIRILTPFPESSDTAKGAARRILSCLPPAVRDGMPPQLGDMANSARARRGRTSSFREMELHERCFPGEIWRDEPGSLIHREATVVWRDAESKPADYERVRTKMAGESASLARGLRDLVPRRVQRHRTWGRLDTRRLPVWRLDDRLFQSPGVRPLELTVALLIDLSGSMMGDSSELARSVAVAFSEAAMRERSIRLYVYGHTADGVHGIRTEIVRFSTPAKGAVLSLGSLPIGANNRDAHAIDVVADDLVRLEGSRRRQRVGILISDGAPAARGFRGPPAIEETRAAWRRFERRWGPSLLLATTEAAAERGAVPGPTLVLDPDAPTRGIVGTLRRVLLRSASR